MAKKDTSIVPFAGESGGPVVVPSLRELRRTTLISVGMLSPRGKYKSAEDKKAARKVRAKERRADRMTFLESQGLGSKRRPKLTKAEKKERRLGRRRTFNELLRAHPEKAAELGIDISRLRV